MSGSVLFIANPHAGSGRAGRILPAIRTWLAVHGRDHKIVETRERGHAECLAAAAQGHERVVVIGGDGSFQEVVNGVLAADRAGEAPTVGLVPAGRGNDVARGLGLPTDPLACLPIALGAMTRPFDVIRARAADGRERCFAAAGGAGFDAQVAYTMETQRRFWMRGEAGYMLATLNELRRFSNHALTITLRGESEGRNERGVRDRRHALDKRDESRELKERVVRGRFLFVAFANGPYYGGGMKICPEARTDDGLFDVCMVGDLSRFAALKELPGIYRALHVNHPLVEITRVRSMKIEGESGARVHLDGESFGTIPVEISAFPGALRVACSTIDGL